MSTMMQAPEIDKPANALFRVASVDDDPAEHVLMSMAMEKADFPIEVVYFNSGDALLAVLTDDAVGEEVPDVILLDLRMPGLSGYDTLDRLKSHPALSEIPVIIFTSSNRPAEKDMAMARGAAMFQTKPEDFRSMEALVRALPILVLGRPE